VTGTDGDLSSRPSIPRREARTRALELLFAADIRDVSVTALASDEDLVDTFTTRLVQTVVEHRLELDQMIGSHAEGWTLERMPVIDRNVLRLGLAELLYVDDVPPKVAIDEAVELAKQLSTDSSPRFVNGILAAVARERALL
jgi:N utilization substance protein B